MSIIVIWDNPEATVIRCDLLAGWSWEEVTTAQQQIAMMRQAVSHRIDLIVDLSQSPGLPENSLWNIRQLRRKNLNTTHRIVFTGANLTGRAIVRMYQKLFPGEGQRVSLADTLDEARLFLQSADATS